jgi:hypothetical protein
MRSHHPLQSLLVFASACVISVTHAQTSASNPASPAWQRLERYSLSYAYPGTQLKDHVYARSARHFARGDAARDAITTPDALRARQAEIRRFMHESLGGLPAFDTPLNPKITGTVQGNGFTIEKIIFESRPRHYVTANLYLPAQRTGKTAAVLFVCGHHNTAKQVAEYQSVCQTLVQAGLIVLAQDPIGQGERLSYYEAETKRAAVRAGTYEHDFAGAQARFVGDQIARYFLHDSMRSIDYLISRPEVDSARIGVTGNSGGGTQTSLVMLADPRIAAAAPATFIMNRESYQWTGQPQDAEQNWFGFTSAGFDHEDILLAMAPKPVCVLAVTWDFFPIEGTRRTVARARRIWDLQQRGNVLELVEDQSTHSYTPTLARAAAKFFAKHLLQRDVDLANVKTAPVPEEQLFATKSGQVRGDRPDAESVFEANLARLNAAEAQRRRAGPAELKAQGVRWLREQVFREREAVDLNPRRIERGTSIDDMTVDIAFWWAQPRLANLGMLFRPKNASGKLPVTIALWDNGSNAVSTHSAWLREECGRGRAVLVLNLCGMGPLRPDPVNSRAETPVDSFRKLVDDLSFIGDSLVAMRTYETLRALDVLAGWPDLATTGVRIYAHGRMGVHGKLAAALDQRISACDWQNGFRFSDFVRKRDYDPTDIKSVLLPGVLRHFDVDEL